MVVDGDAEVDRHRVDDQLGPPVFDALIVASPWPGMFTVHLVAARSCGVGLERQGVVRGRFGAHDERLPAGHGVALTPIHFL